MGVKKVTVVVFVAAKGKGTTVAQGVLVYQSHAHLHSKDSGDQGSIYSPKEIL